MSGLYGEIHLTKMLRRRGFLGGVASLGLVGDSGVVSGGKMGVD